MKRFIEFTRVGGEPFCIDVDQIVGLNIRGLIVGPHGQEVHTEMQYEDLKELLRFNDVAIFIKGA